MCECVVKKYIFAREFNIRSYAWIRNAYSCNINDQRRFQNISSFFIIVCACVRVCVCACDGKKSMSLHIATKVTEYFRKYIVDKLDEKLQK